MHKNPILMLNRTEIPVIDHFKFLSIIFHKKTNLHPPLTTSLKEKCNKVIKLSLLRMGCRPANLTKIIPYPNLLENRLWFFYIKISQEILSEIP